MNHLEVKCERKLNAEGGIYYAVSFFVDGRSLLDMIREFESAFAQDLAGSYANHYFGNYTETFLLGGQPEYGEKGDKTELLSCGDCGCLGCWPFATRIYVNGDAVVWDKFEQPHRTWSYTDFGPFMFDLKEYSNAIKQIPKV